MAGGPLALAHPRVGTALKLELLCQPHDVAEHVQALAVIGPA